MASAQVSVAAAKSISRDNIRRSIIRLRFDLALPFLRCRPLEGRVERLGRLSVVGIGTQYLPDFLNALVPPADTTECEAVIQANARCGWIQFQGRPILRDGSRNIAGSLKPNGVIVQARSLQ